MGPEKGVVMGVVGFDGCLGVGEFPNGTDVDTVLKPVTAKQNINRYALFRNMLYVNPTKDKEYTHQSQ